MNDHQIEKILKQLVELSRLLIDGLGLKNGAARATFAMEVLLTFFVLVVIGCVVAFAKSQNLFGYFILSLGGLLLSGIFVFVLERRSRNAQK